MILCCFLFIQHHHLLILWPSSKVILCLYKPPVTLCVERGHQLRASLLDTPLISLLARESSSEHERVLSSTRLPHDHSTGSQDHGRCVGAGSHRPSHSAPGHGRPYRQRSLGSNRGRGLGQRVRFDLQCLPGHPLRLVACWRVALRQARGPPRVRG